MPGNEGRSARWWHLVLVAAVLAAIVGLAVLAAPHFSRTKLESLVRGAGAWGPLAVIGLQIAQILIAPIPGVFVPILAGILYGPVAGSLIAVVGTVLGAGLAYAIGRKAGLPLILRWAGASNVARAQKLVGGSRWLALALLFLLPFTPADAICFVAGMIGMRGSRFAAAVLLGRVPKDAALALAGAGLIQLGNLVSGTP